MNGMTNSARWTFVGMAWGALAFTTLASLGAEQDVAKRHQDKDSKQLAEPSTIGFYAAIQERKIVVKVVPSSYANLTMRVHNITKAPLRIELPATFAAVPVARVQARQAMQMRGVNASLSSNFGQGYGNSQGLGGSLGGPWWGGSLAQDSETQDAEKPAHDRPQYLALAPGRFAQTRIPCFCLEFGKPDPNSRIPYVICQLDELNNKPAVAELLVQFAKQGINQSVAQLAAWHIANNTPWQMLAKVQFPRTKHSRGHRVTQAELVAARQLAEAMPSYGNHGSLSGNH